MGFFDIFKKKSMSDIRLVESYTSDLTYGGIAIDIDYNVEESKEHLPEDFSVLQNEGIENIIRSRYLPWFKGEEFKDRDDDLILEGLKPYSIVYRYGPIEKKYTHTETYEKGGEFSFFFECGNDYIRDMMESVAMKLYVYNGQIVGTDGYEV